MSDTDSLCDTLIIPGSENRFITPVFNLSKNGQVISNLGLEKTSFKNNSVSFHFVSFLLNCFLICTILAIIRLHFLHGYFKIFFLIIMYLNLIVILFLYIRNVYNSLLFKFLNLNYDNPIQISKYIDLIQNKNPNIYFICKCYHYKNEVYNKNMNRESVNSDDSDYNIKKENINKFDKIITFKKKIEFTYKSCQDYTTNMNINLEDFIFINMKFKYDIEIGDISTLVEFYRQKREIENTYKNNDQYCDVSTYITIDEFQKFFRIKNELKKNLLYNNKICYIIISVLLVFWPFKVFLEKFILKGKITFFKKIYC